jgi:hypothetical protein
VYTSEESETPAVGRTRRRHSTPGWRQARTTCSLNCALHAWLQVERARVPDGSGIARAIDYSLNHWVLTANLGDGRVPMDNNHTSRT